jgi:hypothetical protein
VNAPLIVPANPLPAAPVMEQAKDEASPDKPKAAPAEQVAMLERAAG